MEKFEVTTFSMDCRGAGDVKKLTHQNVVSITKIFNKTGSTTIRTEVGCIFLVCSRICNATGFLCPHIKPVSLDNS